MKLVDKLWKICHCHTYITVDGAWKSERLWLLFILLALLFLFKFYPSVYFFCVVLWSFSGSLAWMSRNCFLLCSGFLKCEYESYSWELTFTLSTWIIYGFWILVHPHLSLQVTPVEFPNTTESYYKYMQVSGSKAISAHFLWHWMWNFLIFLVRSLFSHSGVLQHKRLLWVQVRGHLEAFRSSSI
jgi:hypothetical protein